MSKIRNNFSNISSPYSSFLIKNATQRNFPIFSSFFSFFIESLFRRAINSRSPLRYNRCAFILKKKRKEKKKEKRKIYIEIKHRNAKINENMRAIENSSLENLTTLAYVRWNEIKSCRTTERHLSLYSKSVLVVFYTKPVISLTGYVRISTRKILYMRMNYSFTLNMQFL